MSDAHDLSWAIVELEPHADRWNRTIEWHDPPFHDGTIKVATSELHALAILLPEVARLRAALSTAETREAALREALDLLRMAYAVVQKTAAMMPSVRDSANGCRNEALAMMDLYAVAIDRALASPTPPVKEGT